MERMAPEEPLKSKPGPSKQAVFFDGLVGIIRAGRVIATMRPQQRGNHLLVEADEGKEEAFHRPEASRVNEARKAAYCSRRRGQEASTISARVMTSISIGVFNESLFRRNSSRARRRARFLRTAFPTFRLETADIRGYPRSFRR